MERTAKLRESRSSMMITRSTPSSHLERPTRSRSVVSKTRPREGKTERRDISSGRSGRSRAGKYRGPDGFPCLPRQSGWKWSCMVARCPLPTDGTFIQVRATTQVGQHQAKEKGRQCRPSFPCMCWRQLMLSRVSWLTPSVIFVPVWLSTLTGLSAIDLSNPPTRAFAFTPAPRLTPAVTPP